MSIKVVIGRSAVNVISAYIPQVGLDKKEKKVFWEVLDEMVRFTLSSKKLFIGGDFNWHIGSVLGGYNYVHGGFSFEERNEGRASLLDFSSAYELWVANLGFSKKEEHLITFRSSMAKTQIDFFTP
ncbi:uncharacterized protein LOC107872187 [Capsicum annuum]|uniref:uncharacterized protein LOC107872187 n=1 Tax=Capsicum annuum TaxID=4072 RepID=UPI0007BFBC12|nr:uncharacterized protein LOC107872187 [Capsicum annuum]